MKGLGAAAVASAGLVSTSTPAAAFDIDWEDAATLAATAVVGGPIGLGWALRDTEVLGQNPPADGLTLDAFKQSAKQTFQTRSSTNRSTIVDNRNILDGLPNTAYTEAKIAAIEQLNDGAAEADVLSAAEGAANSYFSVVEKNLFKTWNETIGELNTTVLTWFNHPDTPVSLPGDLTNESYDLIDWISPLEPNNSDLWYDGSLDHTVRSFENWITDSTRDVTLPDGSSFTVKELAFELETKSDGGNYNPMTIRLTPENKSGTYPRQPPYGIRLESDTSVNVARADLFKEVYDEIETKRTDVISGLDTWVTSVYGDVQSGDLELSELVTPRERAAMYSEDEGSSQALADLIALNIPVDPQREVTMKMDNTKATLRGVVSLTDESDGPISTGTSYVPADMTGDIYLTTDLSTLSGEWSAYQTGISDGVVTFTSKPYDGVEYEVTTAAEETFTTSADSFSENGTGGYEYIASAKIETTNTDIESVSYHSPTEEVRYETLHIEEPFTVTEIVNTETGETTDSTSFESTEPQNDTNYITSEDWKELEQQNQELIDKYEDSQGGGGLSVDWSGFSVGGIPGKYVVGAAGTLAIYLGLTN